MNPRRHIELELLQLRWKRGDRGALDELIGNWERPLFFYIRRITVSEEDAWDALQEVWYKVLRHFAGVRDPKALPHWLYTVARNTALSRLRGERQAEPLDETVIEEPVEDGLAEVINRADAIDLRGALEKLGASHREAVTLFFLEEFSVAEIAEITGAPPGTVKSRLYHAKRELKRLLNSESAERS